MKRVIVAVVTLLSLLGCSNAQSSVSSFISSSDDSSLSESQSESFTYRANGIPINGITTEYFTNDYLDCRIFRYSSPLTNKQDEFMRFKSVNEAKSYASQLKKDKDPYYGTLYYKVMIDYLESLNEEDFTNKDLVVSQVIANSSMGITDHLTNVELKNEQIYCYIDRYNPGKHGLSMDCAMAYECLVIYINKDAVFNQVEIVTTEV